MIIFC